MTNEIDVGGNQCRGNPRAGRPSQFLADPEHTEPETADLGLAPMTHAEHTLLRIGYVLSGLAAIALIVSCIDGVVL